MYLSQCSVVCFGLLHLRTPEFTWGGSRKGNNNNKRISEGNGSGKGGRGAEVGLEEEKEDK